MKLIDNFRIGLQTYIDREIMFVETTKEEYINEFGIRNIKLSFLADIFGMVTYDSGLDIKFGKYILEIMDVIAKGYNFEYIKNEKNYIKFILVANILDNYNWIEWGSSIRGCWFSPYNTPNVCCGIEYYNMNEITFDHDNNDIIECVKYFKSDSL